jgi:hypothetical protein
MRLRSSAHSSHVLDSFYRHGGIVLASSTQPNNRTAKIAKIAKEQKVNQLSGFFAAVASLAIKFRG